MRLLLDNMLYSKAAELRGDVNHKNKVITVDEEAYDAIIQSIIEPNFTLDCGDQAPKVYFKDYLIRIKAK